MICIVIAQFFMFLLFSTAAASVLSSASKYQQETKDGVRFDLINLFNFYVVYVVFHYHKASWDRGASFHMQNIQQRTHMHTPNGFYMTHRHSD